MLFLGADVGVAVLVHPPHQRIGLAGDQVQAGEEFERRLVPVEERDLRLRGDHESFSVSRGGEGGYETWDYLQNNVRGSVVGVYFPPGSFGDFVYAVTVPSVDLPQANGGLSYGPK